jgi:hypothetical protein
VVRMGVQFWHAGSAALIVAGACGCKECPAESGHFAPPEQLAPATLRCDTVIATVETTPPGYTVVRDIVALPAARDNATTIEGPVHPRTDRGGPTFFKTGLLVRPGATFKLVVPEARRSMVSIQWGGGHAPKTWELTVPACPGSARWNVFAGGFWVEEPGCVELIVRDGAHDEVLQFGVGAPCSKDR